MTTSGAQPAQLQVHWSPDEMALQQQLLSRLAFNSGGGYHQYSPPGSVAPSSSSPQLSLWASSAALFGCLPNQQLQAESVMTHQHQQPQQHQPSSRSPLHPSFSTQSLPATFSHELLPQLVDDELGPQQGEALAETAAVRQQLEQQAQHVYAQHSAAMMMQQCQQAPATHEQPFQQHPPRPFGAGPPLPRHPSSSSLRSQGPPPGFSFPSVQGDHMHQLQQQPMTQVEQSSQSYAVAASAAAPVGNGFHYASQYHQQQHSSGLGYMSSNGSGGYQQQQQAAYQPTPSSTPSIRASASSFASTAFGGGNYRSALQQQHGGGGGHGGRASPSPVLLVTLLHPHHSDDANRASLIGRMKVRARLADRGGKDPSLPCGNVIRSVELVLMFACLSRGDRRSSSPSTAASVPSSSLSKRTSRRTCRSGSAFGLLARQCKRCMVSCASQVNSKRTGALEHWMAVEPFR
jgi:hypothetical protein